MTDPLQQIYIGSGGVLGGGCFAAGTLIATPTGDRVIEAIQQGDVVWCFDHIGMLHASEVTEISQHDMMPVRRVDFWGGELIGTDNHYVLAENNTFRELSWFEVDDALYDLEDGIRPVEAVLALETPHTVYNFKVDVYHTYFANGIRVHNGGGGKKGKGGKESADTGRSGSKATIVELLGEGIIEGLVGGAKGIFLDKTPIENADGSRNFTGFAYDTRNGSQAQDRLAGYADTIDSETSVGVEVKFNLPVVRNITNANIDGIRIRLGVQLQEYKDNGDIVGSSIGVNVYVKQGAGGFVLVRGQPISGKYSSTTEFEYYFRVENNGGTTAQFAIKVEKTTPDSTSSKKQQTLRFQSYTEVIETKLSYPNSAIVGMQFDAEQFSSAPARSYKTGGRLIKIPTNATVNPFRGLTFSGAWNGTFYTPATACADPAWIVYDLMSNPRYGLGRYFSSGRIDIASLFACSQYNNEMISDGNGGVEPRYTCHLYLQTKESVWKVITSVCSAMNVKPYWSGGSIFFAQDRPSAMVRQFTQADVEEGIFTYISTPVRARHTVALVTWNDPDDFYRQSVESVEDVDGIDRYGVQEIEITAYGCTSRGQATRMGRWALFSDRLESETVSFKARSFAAYCRPGETIGIADAKRAFIRYGGLVVDATTTAIGLDSPVNLVGGETISCTMNDLSLQERTITNGAGSFLVVNVSVPFSNIAARESNWIISSPSVKPQLFKVVSVTPASGDPTSFEIAAIKHRSDKYNAIENGWSLEVRPTRVTIPSVVNVPRNVRPGFVELFDAISGQVSFSLTAQWEFPLNGTTKDLFVTSYSVEFRRGEAGIWQDTRTVVDLETRFENVSSGLYYVRVASVSLDQKSSFWVESQGIFLGVVNVSTNFNNFYSSQFLGVI